MPSLRERHPPSDGSGALAMIEKRTHLKQPTPIRKLPRGITGRGIAAGFCAFHEQLEELTGLSNLRLGVYIYAGPKDEAYEAELSHEYGECFMLSVDEALDHTSEAVRRYIEASNATPPPDPQLLR